jgi:uncharacterized membrane protein
MNVVEFCINKNKILMRRLKQQTAFWLSLLSGIGLLYIGIRFFISPLNAEIDYGIHTITNGDFSFQYIKGIRDFFFGLIIIVLLWKKQLFALGLILLLGTVIPAADFCVVLSHPDFQTGHLISHLIAVIICLSCGFYYLKNYKTLVP